MKHKGSLFCRLLMASLMIGFVAQAASAANFFTPVGTHDLANCSTIAGWAKDGDTTLPIQVAIYKGAPYPFGTHVANIVADKYRSGLPFADKNHGFSIPTPSVFKTGCQETVYIYAINADTNGNVVPGATNPLLNSTGKTVLCGPIQPYCFPRPEDPPFQLFKDNETSADDEASPDSTAGASGDEAKE